MRVDRSALRRGRLRWGYALLDPPVLLGRARGVPVSGRQVGGTPISIARACAGDDAHLIA
jgi:hypothetical protein